MAVAVMVPWAFGVRPAAATLRFLADRLQANAAERGVQGAEIADARPASIENRGLRGYAFDFLGADQIAGV